MPRSLEGNWREDVLFELQKATEISGCAILTPERLLAGMSHKDVCKPASGHRPARGGKGNGESPILSLFPDQNLGSQANANNMRDLLETEASARTGQR